MKLLRYGPVGQEKVALLDHQGRLRELSSHIAGLSGAALLPASLDLLRSIDPSALPEVNGTPRIGPCVAGLGKSFVSA
jgi:hypothetical protein